MKERPILFSGPMVRAILEGRKTQTRRVIKEQPPERYKDLYYECNWHGKVGPVGWFWSRSTSGAGAEQQDLLGINPCPHGTVGDRLWVREAWAKAGEVTDVTEYRADNHDPKGAKWRPSIHMPRWASRITLEITGVRVERLREISKEDAIAEGVSEIVVPGIEYGPYGDPVQPLDCSATDRDRFDHLWQSIHGAESWFANPWVWVIEFMRVEQC